MTLWQKILLAFSLAALAQPAAAQWRLVEAGETREVARADLLVTPQGEWNRAARRPNRWTEIWTKDGTTLGELDFWLGIKPGKPLFEETDKKRAPLPKFDPAMLPPDIVRFFEDTARIVLGGALFETGRVRPAQLAGHPGIHIEYSYTGGDNLERRGEVRAAIVGERLYMINWDAPALHYFDAHIEEVRAIMDSARFEKAR